MYVPVDFEHGDQIQRVHRGLGLAGTINFIHSILSTIYIIAFEF